MTAGPRELPAFLVGGPRRIAAPVSSAPPAPGARSVPGEVGLWVFLLGDLTLFGLFFVGFAVQMSERRGEWAASTSRLHEELALVNTIVLLVSSYVLARAVAAWRSGGARRGRLLMAAAAGAGIGFAAIKVSEYGMLIAAGVSPEATLFFTYYFALTGIHLVHVVIGVVVLGVCALRGGERFHRFIEGSASYWHMIDLVWVVLFPLLYLVGRVA